MARYQHLPVFQDSYDLVIEIHKRVEKFPRIHRYSIGEKLKEISFNILDLIIKTNSLEQKTETLKEAEMLVEKLKVYIRLCYDLKIFGSKGFEYVVKKIDAINRQILKWKEWSLKQKSI
jgi:hypothetical protein